MSCRFSSCCFSLCCFSKIYNGAVEGGPLMAEIRRQLSPTDEAWQRKWTFPFEDRHTLTTAPWREARFARTQSHEAPLDCRL
jgi:hypothetical protein